MRKDETEALDQVAAVVLIKHLVSISCEPF